MRFADQGKMGCVGRLAKMSRIGFVDQDYLASHSCFVRTGTTQLYFDHSAHTASC